MNTPQAQPALPASHGLAVWCVRSRDGWCACNPNQDPGDDTISVPTKCAHFIVLPMGKEFRQPDCPVCIAVLSKPPNTTRSAPFVLFSAKWSRWEAVWWRPNGKGYTNNLEAAGDYAEDEALRIAADCHGDAIAIRRSDLAKLKTRRVLDFGDGNNREDFQDIISQNASRFATPGGGQ